MHEQRKCENIPEIYRFTPTPTVPNSRLPVLVYRKVLPATADAEAVRQVIEQNKWLQGGVFKTYRTCHFHSVTHECYAIFKGTSRLRLGRGPLDESGGTEVDLGPGDVIILPAGVSHHSITSENDYTYVGLYPEGSPAYDNNWCKAGKEETTEKARIASEVPVPEWDPVLGQDGFLPALWHDALGLGLE